MALAFCSMPRWENYKMKFLARDAETGRIGTFETPFVIPDLNKEEKRIPIINGGAIMDHRTPRERRFVAVPK